MNKKTSIDKLNFQIEMLTNEDFIDQSMPTSNKRKQRTTPRKEIIEEPTVVDDEELFSDLISDDENTKVFLSEETSKIKNNEQKNKTVNDTLEIYENKIKDIYLPTILIILIFIFILLIIFI